MATLSRGPEEAGTTLPPDASQFVFASRSPRDTQLLGARLGELARPRDVFLLIGQLGAGKTCLVQGLAKGLGVEESIVSPSFVLLRQYRGRLSLYHIDLYRLENPEEVSDLGLDDYFYGDGVCAVEWADRAMELLPPEHMLVEIGLTSARHRRIVVKPAGQRYVELLPQLQSALPVTVE